MTEIYVFACDGVIVNSGADIVSAVNEALGRFGFRRVPGEELVPFAGDGVRSLLARALARTPGGLPSDAPAERIDEMADWCLGHYRARPVERTRLCAGIGHFLRVLKERGKKTALLTNTPEDIARAVLEHFGVLGLFDAIVAPGSAVPRPRPDGLAFALEKINRAFGSSFARENVLMVGDSAADIRAGKAFGCRTAACRGGMGSAEELLAAGADFRVSVASELEKFVDILSGRGGGPDAIQSFALQNEVPILQDGGARFICDYIMRSGARRILEIGTAVGYSAIRFARLRSDIRVTTIERDGGLFSAAERNIAEAGFSGRITAIHADAVSADVRGEFDVIFIDAAKAQYMRLFEKFKRNLADGGAIISDNLSFHGMVDDLSLTRNYSTIKLVKKIRKYIAFLKANGEFRTEFFPVGDGVSVSRKMDETR